MSKIDKNQLKVLLADLGVEVDRNGKIDRKHVDMVLKNKKYFVTSGKMTEFLTEVANKIKEVLGVKPFVRITKRHNYLEFPANYAISKDDLKKLMEFPFTDMVTDRDRLSLVFDSAAA